MRVGKLPVYSNASLVATPEDATFDLIYRLSTDDVVYGKKSDGTSYPIAGSGNWNVKGNINCVTNPDYPAADQGDAYLVIGAGKIGGAFGKECQVGDIIIAWADNAGGDEAAVGSDWTVEQGNLEPAVLADYPANTSKYIVPSVLDQILKSLDLRAVAFVDPVNGDDANAVIGSVLFPYKTIAAVEAIVGFTGLVYLMPGTYTDIDAGDSLVGAFYCSLGVVFNPGAGNTTFKTTGKNLVVKGYPSWNGDGSAVNSNTGSLDIEFHVINLAIGSVAGMHSIKATSLTNVKIKGKQLAATNDADFAGIYIANATGNIDINIDKVDSAQFGGFYSNAGMIRTENCDAISNIKIGTITGGCAGFNPLIRINDNGGTGYSVCKIGSVKYLGGMGKVFDVGSSGAPVVGDVDLEIGTVNVSGASGGFVLIETNGFCNVRINQYNYAGADSDIITINGGAASEVNIYAKIKSASNGASIAANSSGKVIVNGRIENTNAVGVNANSVGVYSANAPVVVIETLTSLIANPAAFSVYADAAMNVKVYRHISNVGVNVNVTEQVSATVVSPNAA